MGALRLARGIYLPEHLADDVAARCTAVIAAAPPGTVASGLTAATLHGLWLPPDRMAERLDLTVAADDRASRSIARPQRAEFVIHRRQIAAADLTVVDGVPVTSLARTWFDLASDLARPDLVAAGDSALRGTGLTAADLQEVCVRYGDRRGARRARTCLPLLDPRSRSRPESHLRVALVHPDLPSFAVNQAIADEHGEWIAEPDLSLEEAMLALEYQGADHADTDRMRRDMTRVTDLRRRGWLVLLYGPAEVLRRPAAIAPEVRAILRARAPHLLRPRRRNPRVAL